MAAFPHQKFGHQVGSVYQVSSTPLQAGELAALPLAVKPDEPLYRVTVDLERLELQQHLVAHDDAAEDRAHGHATSSDHDHADLYAYIHIHTYAHSHTQFFGDLVQ